MSRQRVLDPRVLTATRGLRLAAHADRGGRSAGHSGEPAAGAVAASSANTAPIMPGDEPQHIDWKLFARSDRYYLRESEIQTAVTMRIVLDATESMRHADTTGPGAGVRKFDSRACSPPRSPISAQRQGDPVGLHAISDGSVTSVQPGERRQPFERIMHALENLEPAGRWPAAGRELAAAIWSRGVGCDAARRDA